MTRRKLADEVTHGKDLAQRWRPRNLGEVVGQSAVVRSLEAMLKRETRPHCFIFTGPSGVGKTTLARIVAQELGAQHNIVEIDAATNTGVDAMRDVLAGTIYSGFGSNSKFYLIDEAHMLSKAAWNSMLKTLEEPPDHVYFAICTTEPEKLPATISTRGPVYALKSVPRKDISNHLILIAEEESLEVTDEGLDRIAEAAGGSLRAAINMMVAADGVRGDDLDDIIERADAGGNKQVIDLARALVNDQLTWTKLTGILKDLEGQSAEGVRIVVVNFTAACLMKATSDKQIARLLNVLHAFSTPYTTADKMAPLLLSFGNLLYK